METFPRVGLSNAAVAALLALGAASAGVFLRRRPALRHGLWLLVLMKLLTPPLWTLPVDWVVAVAEPATSAPPERPSDSLWVAFEDPLEPGLVLVPGLELAPEVPEAPASAAARWPSLPELPWSWPVVAVSVWAVGSLLTFGTAAWRIRRFQRLLELAEPVSKGTQVAVEELAGQVGLRRVPEVWQVPGVVSPMLWALGGAPRLILPRTLWHRLDKRQRDTLLAHELAHLKRRDHWVRCLELLVTGLYWWLPVVWIARHALREAEEQCCDAWVVWTFPDAARTYALALLETLDFLSGASPAATFAVAASGLGPVHHLKRRMTMIMQGTTPRALTWSGLLAVLGLSATLLPLSPTWAQGPDDDGGAAPPKVVSEKVESDDSSPSEGKRKTEVRVFRFDPFENPEKLTDEALAKEMETLQGAIAKIKEKLGDRVGGPFDERGREGVERALRKMQDELSERLQVRLAEAKRKGELTRDDDDDDEKDVEPKRRGASSREEKEEVIIRRGNDAQSPDIKRLRAEVDAKRKELREAEMKLAKAMQGLASRGSGPGGTRGQRFEFRFSPGDQPPGPPHPPGMPAPPMPPHPPIAPVAPRARITPRPDQDKRIAELEERLEKLQDEVKSLKKDAPERK